ncbi:MAG: hypothetical protein KDA61_19660, partial [Planctomycetales bacterium]|nr:hypothetical protein [Planctomycetales bacterium]
MMVQRRSQFLYAAMICVGVAVGAASDRADANILAFDDFSGAGSGVGWASGNDWEGLENGLVSTNPLGQGSVQSFRDFSAPIDPSNAVTYIKVDYAQASPGNGQDWGGLAFFTGTEGAADTETFFLGNPSGASVYGADLKFGGLNLWGSVAIDDAFHTLVARIDTTGADHEYALWVDNANLNSPTAVTTIQGGGPLTGTWGTLRLASSDAVTDNYDNLVIATTAEEAGLIATDLTLTIDRATGAATLSSAASQATVIGYSLSSTAGSLRPTQWTTVAGRYDSAGDGSVDSDEAWSVIASNSNGTLVSEAVASATPGDGGVINASGVDLGDVWARSPIEDVVAKVRLNSGGAQVQVDAQVVFSGVGPALGDLDGDGDLDVADWTSFKSGQGAIDASMTALSAYRMGDLNGDFNHTLADFDLFANAYDAANGVGAFVAMTAAVPEPTALGLLAVATAACFVKGRRRTRALPYVAAMLAIVLVAG